MEIFQTVQMNLAILGICPHQSTQTHYYYLNEKILKVTLLFGLDIILSCAFFIYEAHTFREYTDAIYITSATVMVTLYFLIFVFKMTKLFALIESFERVINDRLECSTANAIYTETNWQAEKWSKFIYFAFENVTPVMWVLPKCIASMIGYYSTTDANSNDALQLPSPTWFPFNTKTPIGYLLAVALQYLMAKYNFRVLANVTSFGISCILFTLSLAKDIRGNLTAMNEGIESQTGEETNLKARKQIKNVIRLHSAAKQFIVDWSQIYQPFQVILMMWSFLTICGAMLMLQMEVLRAEFKLVLFIQTFFCALYAFGIVCLVCDVVQRIHDAFMQMNFEIGQFDWYLFSNDIQRMLPIIMIVAQESITFKCFGSMKCNRELFKTVFNKSYSNFMVLREFIK